MAILPKLYAFPTAASTAQNFPENIEQIQNLLLISTTGVITSLAPITGSPGTTQVQFTGTVTTPGAAFTLNASPGANALIVANAVPAAGNPVGF